MLRNVASQKRYVFAWDVTTGLPKTGDAANITAQVVKDGGSPASSNDTNPAEVNSTTAKGWYSFDMTQAETDCAEQGWFPQSSTSNIAVVAAPSVVCPVPQYFSLLGIASDGDLNKVNTLDGHTAQTGDAYARLGAPAGASVSADVAAVKTQTAAIETDTQDIQSRLPTSLVSGRIDASVGAMASNVMTAAALATDAVTEIVDAILAVFSDDTGTAQAGASGTITLRSGAVATDDYYNGAVVCIYGGTGAGQSRKITDYVGSTKVATVDTNWVTNPDNTSTYFVIGRIT